MPPSNLAPATGNVIQKIPTANVITAITVEIQDGKNLIYNGNSKVVDPLGKNLENHDNNYILSHEFLEKIRQDFPFLKDQNQFKILKN